MFACFGNLLKLTVNKENLKAIIGKQFTFDLKDYQIPTILDKTDLNELIINLLEDLRSVSDKKSYKDRSDYNRQWRFYGADDFGNNGVDQVENLCLYIMAMKPNRRLLLVALDPCDNSTLSLTQCLLQFYLSDGKLSCKVYQSTSTLGNIIRYDTCRAALLTCMLCHISGLLPGRLVHSFGSILIGNDIGFLNEDHPFPILRIHGNCTQLHQFTFDNFELCYDSLNYDVTSCDKLKKLSTDTHEEMQYINLVASIIETGTKLIDRTGVGTRSLFGPQMVFKLHNGVLPLLTTKRVFYRGIIEELLWFVRGSTNGNELAKKNVHIWDANGSKEFLTGCGLGHREVGDLGPVYGFQWRHFGAKYESMDTSYRGKGVDQINRVINSIKSTPGSASHIVLAWNAKGLSTVLV